MALITHNGITIDRLVGMNYAQGQWGVTVTDADGARLTLSRDAVAHILSVVSHAEKVDSIDALLTALCTCGAERHY